MRDDIYIIGEVGQAHDGSIGMAHSYIDALATVGVNAVKFQMHMAEAESSIYEPFRSGTDFFDPSRMDYWKRIAFTTAQWMSLKQHCKEKNLDFIVSPFSISSINILHEIGVDKVKIGSGDADNLLIINQIVKLNKDIIISSGLSTVTELDQSVAYLKSKYCNLSLLQCATSYPTNPTQWGLNVIGELTERYGIPIGYSDHSGDIYACLAAASIGARMLEFHITFDQRMYGPDASASLNVDRAIRMVRGVREIEIALKHPVDKADNAGFETLKIDFGKSLALNKTLPKGHCIAINDLETKKPSGYGIPAKCYNDIIGKHLVRDVEKWAFLNYQDLI
ncbi:MAG: N-acetylneuraminate synthase family protein [Dyadobacter sp.]|uniref:N-acetylneuraminate synthase family protein n=1 Tax=Dyadobacter sp. TaxID=1914288 RepID=UPI003263315C